MTMMRFFLNLSLLTIQEFNLFLYLTTARYLSHQTNTTNVLRYKFGAWNVFELINIRYPAEPISGRRTHNLLSNKR